MAGRAVDHRRGLVLHDHVGAEVPVEDPLERGQLAEYRMDQAKARKRAAKKAKAEVDAAKVEAEAKDTP